jgi:hypothetical protein
MGLCVSAGHTPSRRRVRDGPREDRSGVTTVRNQPVQAQVIGPGARGPLGAVDSLGARPGRHHPWRHHPGPCDEVLAARLADGMRRVQWLGDALEHLLRRLARRPRP